MLPYSKRLRSHADSITRNTTFTVPGTDITLVLTLGRRELPEVRVTELLYICEAKCTKEVEQQSGEFRPAQLPFRAVADEGVEIQFYNSGESPNGMTWGQLQETVHGLWIYIIGGEHFFVCHFDVFFAESPHIFIHIGWGNIVQVIEPDTDLPGNASRATISYQPTPLSASPSVKMPESDLLHLGMRNSSLAKSSSLSLRNAPFHFQVPNTEMALSLTVRNEKITWDAIEALLIGARDRINDEINIYGENAAINGQSFQYAIATEGVLLEVISWRSAPDSLIWGQLADIVQGLALFYFGEHSFGCHFKALYGDAELTVGVGRIAKGGLPT